MKKAILLVVVIIIVAGGLYLIGVYDFKPQVTAGQTWIYKRTNPFESIVIIKKVIDVKDGYVKYTYDGYDSSEFVDKIKWFKSGSKLSKE